MDPRIARSAVLSALLFGIVAELLFDRSALGINVPIATAIVVAAVTWFAPTRRPADGLDLWLPAVALAASLGPAFRTDPNVVVLDLGLSLAAVFAWSVAVSGIAVTRRAATTVVVLGAQAGIAAATGLAWLVSRGASDGGVREGLRRLGRATPVVRGAIIAIPIVAGFAVLLGSADAVFGRAIDDAFRFPFDVDDAVRRGTFVLFAAFLVAGPLAIAVGGGRVLSLPMAGVAVPPSDALPPESLVGAQLPNGFRAFATEATVVLVAVDLLFAAFAIVQVVFLFGGTSTLAAIGMTYSDYARQGYFQLVGVVALAGLLLLGAHEVIGRTRRFLVLAFALLALTGLILASAALRLGLYQGAYGWTELRFFVVVSIAWLAACIFLAAAALASNRMRWLPHGIAMSAVSITLVVSAVGPQAFVMRQNLARVLDPGLVATGGHAGLDLEYAATLGDDAIPDLVAALAILPEPERTSLRADLLIRRDELVFEAATEGPTSWNLARERARAALAGLPASGQ